MIADEERIIDEKQIVKARLDQAEWRVHRLAFFLRLVAAALICLVVVFIIVVIVISFRSGRNDSNEPAVVVRRSAVMNLDDQFNDDTSHIRYTSKLCLSRVQALVEKYVEDAKLAGHILDTRCGSNVPSPNLEADLLQVKCAMDTLVSAFAFK